MCSVFEEGRKMRKKDLLVLKITSSVNKDFLINCTKILVTRRCWDWGSMCVCVCVWNAHSLGTPGVTNVICVLSEPDVITRLKSTTHPSHQLSASPNLSLQGVTRLLIKTAGYSDGSFLKTFTDTVLAKSTSTLRQIHYEDDCHHDHMWYYLLMSVWMINCGKVPEQLVR